MQIITRGIGDVQVTNPKIANATIDLTSKVTGALPIANGGTGQTSQTAAFDALAPSTTKGDVIVHNGTDNIRVAVGTNGQYLVADSAETSGVKWASSPVPTWNKEAITLDGTDITNQYVDLAQLIVANSLDLMFGGLLQRQTTDYTLSTEGGVTRVTFAGDLATGGNSALIATDVIYFKYQY